MIRNAVGVSVVAASFALATPTYAAEGDFTLMEPHTGDRPKTLELHAGFGFAGLAPTVGARFGIPIVKNGFIPSMDNAVYFTVGADVGFTLGTFSGVAIGVPVTVAWNFYFNDKFSAFADVGINLYFNTYYLRGGVPLPIGNFFMGSVGGRYHLNEKLALMARVGSPYTAIGIELTL